MKKKNEAAPVKEEKPLDPKAEQEKLYKSLDVIELSKEEPEKPFNELVEEKRKNIFVTYKKARTRSNIIMIAVVVVFVASIVLAVSNQQWGMITGGCLIGATLVFLIVNYILTKNTFPNTTRDYIKYFMLTSDNYLFNNKDFSDAKLFVEKRYTLADVLADRCYADVIDCVSRNLVEGKYKGKEFNCGELAFYKAGDKKHVKHVVFVGRYLSMGNKLHFEDRYIINIRGEKETDLPTDISDLVELSSQNRFVIYGKEGANFEKDLGKDFINNLKSIDCTGALLNVNVVVWAGHTACYLSYDDSIVAIPFDKAIEPNSYTQLKKNLSDVLEIVSE